MKDFFIALSVFGIIVVGIVFATKDDLSNDRPAVSVKAATPTPLCSRPKPNPALRPSPAVKVIKVVKIVPVPVSRVYVREVYHTQTQQVIYVRGDNLPSTQTTSYIQQMQLLSSRRPYDPEIEEDYQRMRARLGL